MDWTAYVDESMRVAADPQDRAYVLAAAVVDTDYIDLLRPIVAALAVSGPRFHWRHESAKAQLKAVETVAALPALHVVVVGTPLDLRDRSELAGSASSACCTNSTSPASLKSGWKPERNR